MGVLLLWRVRAVANTRDAAPVIVLCPCVFTVCIMPALTVCPNHTPYHSLTTLQDGYKVKRKASAATLKIVSA